MTMKTSVATFSLIALLLTSTSFAATREEKRVADAADVIDQLLRIPEKTIPPNLLARAYAVAVVPNVVKAAFGLGARRGKGILVVRQDDNSWSNPAFITLTGGSVGWQIGAQSTDIILVFKTRRGVDGIASGKLTLGADASVAHAHDPVEHAHVCASVRAQRDGRPVVVEAHARASQDAEARLTRREVDRREVVGVDGVRGVLELRVGVDQAGGHRQLGHRGLRYFLGGPNDVAA